MTSRRRIRPAAPPVRDRIRDRPHWLVLAQLAQKAAGFPEKDAGALAEAAIAGRNGLWEWPAAFPEGLLCDVLARTAYAFGRQRSSRLRSALADQLRQSAETVLSLLELTDPGTAPAESTPETQQPARRLRADIDG